MRAEPIHFHHDVPLTGTLYLPEGDGPHPALVVLHSASGGERSYPFYHHLSVHLPAAGIALLLYDRRGAGESGGHFATADFEALAADGVAAAEALAARPDIDPARISVYGISQGGWLAPIVAARRPETACVVVASGSGVSPARQMDYATARTVREMGYGEAAVARLLYLRGRVNRYYRGELARDEVQAELDVARAEPWYSHGYLIGPKGLPEDVELSKWHHEMDYDPLSVWREVRQPVLFIYPEDDRWIPVAESVAAFRGATAHLNDATFAQIPNSDHLMGMENEADPRISAEYLTVLVNWLQAHLSGASRRRID